MTRIELACPLRQKVSRCTRLPDTPASQTSTLPSASFYQHKPSDTAEVPVTKFPHELVNAMGKNYAHIHRLVNFQHLGHLASPGSRQKVLIVFILFLLGKMTVKS